MAHQVYFKSSVLEDLQKLGQTKGERILREIYQKIACNPKRGDVLKSGTTELWQHKIDHFTIIYSFTHDQIKILLII